MKTKSNAMKQNVTSKFILLFVAVLMSFNSYASIQEEPEYTTWLNEFVTLRIENKDSSLPLLKIKDYYNQLSDIDKGNFKSKIIEHISVYLKANKKNEAMAMMDLYDLFADKEDVKRPDLYFIRGNIYAERKDTVMLKETIAQLEKFDDKKDYADKLNRYLLQIRGFALTDYSLNGYWVSDVLMSDVWGSGLDIPKYIIKVTSNDSITNMTITEDSPFITKVCITTKPLIADKIPQTSQYLFPFNKDSLYVSWSSEKLKNYDANLVGGLRQLTGITSATISSELAQRHEYSTGEALAGSLVNSAVEIGLNSLFDALFTPSKKIYVLEGKFKRVNDNILKGKLKYTSSKIKAGEEDNARFNTETEDITLLRWTPESGVVFMSWWGIPITPYEYSLEPVEKQKKKIEKAKKKGKKVDERILPYWEDLANDTSTEYGRAYQERKKNKNKKEFSRQWNKKQIEKLREYNMEYGNNK